MNGYGSYPSEYEDYDRATKRRGIKPGSVSSLNKFRFKSQVPSESQSLPEVKPQQVRYLGDNGEVNPNWRPEHGLPNWLRNQMMATQGRFNEQSRAQRSNPNSPEAIAARQFWNARLERQRSALANRGPYKVMGLGRNPLSR
jgi:hypothetical protein